MSYLEVNATKHIHVLLTPHGGSVKGIGRMASNTAAPYPEAFNFSKPEAWPTWIKRFDRFLEVNQIDKEERQVSTLVYAMGSRAEDILLIDYG